MQLQVDDNVVYENLATIDPNDEFYIKNEIPTIVMAILKVKQVNEDNTFIDSNDMIRKNYRVRYIFKKGKENKIEYDGYDWSKIEQETKEVIKKVKERKNNG